MFGLMKAKTCGMTQDERHFRRLHYCGTCKTIGRAYGQAARLMLNHDTVFLAEVLTSLSGVEIAGWDKSYKSFNCLSLPSGEMPFSLRYAAAANVILAEFKINDHIDDTRQRRFRIAHRIFSKQFIAAEKNLFEWGFPLDHIRELLQTQRSREEQKLSFDDLAFPTAETTAIFFAQGATLSGRPELAETAHALGFAFGRLVYFVDAFEDFDKDLKTGEFNAFRGTAGEDLRQANASLFHDLEKQIIDGLCSLPIPEARRTLLAARLSINLRSSLKLVGPAIPCRSNRLTFAERFARARDRARELTQSSSWVSVLPVFVFVMLVAFVAPVHAREAKSARECFDLSFNLMFLGSAFGAFVAIPKNMMQGGGGYTPPTPEELNQFKKKTHEAAGGASPDSDEGGGCCNFCDCCDCCGDCDCASGCCDSCDCCDCNCDC